MANPMTKLGQLFRKMNPFENTRNSSQRGKTYPNQMNILYDRMRVEMDRLKAYEECWVMYSEDSRIAAAIDTTAGSATNGSFKLQFNKAKSTEAILKDAEEIIDSIIKRTNLHNMTSAIAKELIILGDVFLEVIFDFKTLDIMDLKKLPARTIERIEDEYGNLVKFIQKNEIGEVLAEFQPWQILHMRWNHFTGQKYGTSMIRPIRLTYKKLKMVEEDLVIRRRTRAGLKMHHYGSTADSPLEEWEVDEYIDRNQSNPMNVRTDFYSNGKWKIDVLKSDDGVNEIDDIKHLEDALFIGLRTPKGLLGIGEDPNRATLERQEVAYIRLLNEVTNVISGQLRMVFELGLSLKGLDAKNIEYEMVWSEKTMEDVNRKAERLVLLANGGYISRQTATGEMGYKYEDEQIKIKSEQEQYSKMDYMKNNFDKNGDPILPYLGDEYRIAKGDYKASKEDHRGNIS